MREYILDTSVAIAWYLPESFSDAARSWQDRNFSGQIGFIAPRLHFLEFAYVLRTYIKRSELDRETASEIYELHLEAQIRVTEPSLGSVFKVALEFDCTSYDAVYIHLALEHETPLLTAERTTTPWIVKLGDLACPIA